MTDHPEPFDDDLDAFLTGEARLCVDPIFAKTFPRVLDEFGCVAPGDIRPDDRDPGVPSLIDPTMTYREVPVGIMLYDADGLAVGGYLSCDLSLSAEHHGRGLGAEIVIERCLRDGMNPVLHLDEASYSPAGLAAHTAAWRTARSRPDETRLRAARIGATA